MRIRALPLVAVMWVMTGGSLLSASIGSPSLGQPTANPGHVVALLMGWMCLLLAACFLRFWVAPAQVEGVRNADGVAAATEHADICSESLWYLLGLAPVIALVAYAVTAWAPGAVALWLGGFAAMLLLAPDSGSLHRLAEGPH